jgi:hypothetical protein
MLVHLWRQRVLRCRPTRLREETTLRITANRWPILLLGLLLVLMGTIWALQGLGLVRGSVMTGQGLWLVVGALVALVGLGLVYWGLRMRPKKS